MREFHSKSQSWQPGKASASISGTFVTEDNRSIQGFRRPEDIQEAQIGSNSPTDGSAKSDIKTFSSELELPLPNPPPPGYLKPCDSDLIWDALSHGKAVPVFSQVLNEWIFWVWGQREHDRLASVHPNSAIYTFAELSALTKSGVTQQGLHTLHNAKKILTGTFS